MIINKIKKLLKTRLFHKYATCGINLQVTECSYCISPSKDQLTIGDNCDLSGCRLYVLGKGKIQIGSHSTIRGNSKISSVCGVTIGNHVIISNNVDIYDHNSHPTDPKTRWDMCEHGFYGEDWSPERAEKKAVLIESNVWIGEKTAILKGVTIGKGSIVASHSVVVKDVQEYTVVAGNPAKVVKDLPR